MEDCVIVAMIKESFLRVLSVLQEQTFAIRKQIKHDSALDVFMNY